MTSTRITTLSLAERDRRWAAVRAAMAERGLDALIIRGTSLKWDGGTANIRYLSQIGGNGEEAMMVFPAAGEPIVLVWAPSQRNWWAQAQDWVKEFRQGSPNWSEATVAAVREVGHAGGRIGVVGIGGRTEAGNCMSYDIYAGILAAMPDAHFEPASDILERLRIVKSPEEIAFMEKSGALCDAAVAAMLEAAGRSGVKSHEVYAEILYACYRAGGEAPMFLMYEADPAAYHALRFPTTRALEPGYVLLQEILPKYAGYFTQIMVPVCIGEPDAEYRRLGDAATAAYHECINAARPGISTIELAAIMNRPIVEAGLIWTRPQWHGTGLENVEPPTDRTFPGNTGPKREVTLRPGMILGVQPMAAFPDRRKGVQIGDTIVITDTGCRRLSKSEMRFYAV
jgi:Xaa-Pro aminopeptidase